MAVKPVALLYGVRKSASIAALSATDVAAALLLACQSMRNASAAFSGVASPPCEGLVVVVSSFVVDVVIDTVVEVVEVAIVDKADVVVSLGESLDPPQPASTKPVVRTKRTRRMSPRY